ncbi:MAG: hypothetical protein JWO55_81 [Candidatus Saccharibacteria bacterium]|jgi:hypothetical protein|nr:hypothetical protein [Candidatus Saccharibacteria bacterium]
MQHKLSQPVAALIVIVMIAAATASVSMINDKQTQEPLSTNEPATSMPTAPSSPRQTASPFKDGIYGSDGQYSTPGGSESIGITVTLKDGVIEDINLEQYATGGDTQIYQRKFASRYKESVVGKSIDEVKLTRVAGSSLTSNGFNDALESIKRDAAI